MKIPSHQRATHPTPAQSSTCSPGACVCALLKAFSAGANALIYCQPPLWAHWQAGAEVGVGVGDGDGVGVVAGAALQELEREKDAFGFDQRFVRQPTWICSRQTNGQQTQRCDNIFKSFGVGDKGPWATGRGRKRGRVRQHSLWQDFQAKLKIKAADNKSFSNLKKKLLYN